MPNTTSAPFRTFAVQHEDGTKGRVMGIDGDYARISFREGGKDETVEVNMRRGLAHFGWHRP